MLRYISAALGGAAVLLVLIAAVLLFPRPVHAKESWRDLGSPCPNGKAINVSVTTNAVAVVCANGHLYTFFIQ